MHDVCNVQAASRKAGGDHNRALGRFERATVQSVSKLIEITENIVSHRILSFPLGSSSMNGGAWQAPVVQVIIHKVHLLLAVHEDQRADGDHAHKQIEEGLLLHTLIHVENLVYEDMSNRMSNSDGL